MSIEVIGLGALNMDHIYQVERILEDGEALVKRYAQFPGGSAANTIFGLARLGVSTGFIGATGDDAEGKALKQDLQKAGVDVSQVIVKPGAKSGSVLGLSDALGHRTLYVLPGANSLLATDDVDPAYVNKTRILHISSFVADRQFRLTAELMEALKPAAKVSFSPGALYAVKGLKVLRPILRRTYVLFLNRDEIKQVTSQDFIAGAETCLKAGCQMVVVTLGKGARLKSGRRAIAYIRTARKEYTISPSAEKVEASETTGAGDAFAAGFIYGMLKSKTMEECGHLGDILAGFAISKSGARKGLPTLPRLARRYQELYHQPL